MDRSSRCLYAINRSGGALALDRDMWDALSDAQVAAIHGETGPGLYLVTWAHSGAEPNVQRVGDLPTLAEVIRG